MPVCHAHGDDRENGQHNFENAGSEQEFSSLKITERKGREGAQKVSD